MKDHNEDPLPAIIPEVVFDGTGEPMIAKTMVVEPSPIPRSMALFILIMVVSSVVYGVVQERQRNGDQRLAEIRNSMLIQQIQGQQKALADAQNRATADREALRNLVLALSLATTPEEQARLLRDFAAQQSKRTDSAQPSPTAQPSAAPSRGRPSPALSPADPTVRPSASARPSAAPSASPSAPTSPAPVVPILPCITTIVLGNVCI